MRVTTKTKETLERLGCWGIEHEQREVMKARGEVIMRASAGWVVIAPGYTLFIPDGMEKLHLVDAGPELEGESLLRREWSRWNAERRRAR